MPEGQLTGKIKKVHQLTFLVLFHDNMTDKGSDSLLLTSKD